ncbi:hypothetical protein DFP72DRAFT_973716 [Ephemerocybe angulata]|uniref:Uncharacterized protein n=1 Tax=Ephemerocybe angulata TaxID=980116 RepID=A0A8H6LXN4_9AGAR|nr:hypothetical protein DFP72DRAFT_973716 [Tulosesus angulatus]
MSTTGTLRWTPTMIWSLLGELAREENHAALYGEKKGEKTHGDTKKAIHKRIAGVLFPDTPTANETAMANKVKSKIENLRDTYRTQLKRLTQTGGGLGGNDETGDSGQDSEGEDEAEATTMSVSYIGADGPDENTSASARNLWEDILKKFPYFSDMHSHLCGRPNTIPPAITTGVGPSGPTTVIHRASQPSQAPASAPVSTSAETPARRPALAPVSTNTSGGKCTPRPSSFGTTAAAVEKAKIKIQKTPARKNFEDRLAETAEKSLAASLRIEEKKMILSQLDQLDRKRDAVFRGCENKLYTAEESRLKLETIDNTEDSLRCKLSDLDDTPELPSAKRARRSVSDSSDEDDD